MEAIAAGDEVALDFMHVAVFPEGDAGRAGDIAQCHVLRFVDRGSAGRRPRVHEIASDFGLAIHRHGFASDLFQCNAMPRAVESDLHTVVRQPLGMQAGRDTGMVEHLNGAGFQHAGANTSQNVVRAAPLQDQRVDASSLEQLTQQ
jgi:hypothetical protein